MRSGDGEPFCSQTVFAMVQVLFRLKVWVVHGWWFSMAGVEFCWIREWPTCGDGEANDAMIPPTAVLWQWLFRVPVAAFKGRVLSLVSVYGPVSGAGFDDERRVMFDSISAILGLLPERSVWIIGGDFNAETGYRGVGEGSTLGVHAHGRRARSGRQMMEWALGEELRFLLSFSRQACRDTWFHPKSFTGHAIDHLLCRSRDHRFLGASKVLFEDTVGEAWSAYTDHNPVEVKLAKGWVCRARSRFSRRLRRPNWVALRGFG